MAHRVTVNSLPPGTVSLYFPNRINYHSGQSVVLTDEEFAQLDPNLLGKYLTDGGYIGASGGITAQAAAVAPIDTTTYDLALTSTSSSPVGFTTASQVTDLQASVNQLITTVNAIIAALSVTGGPMV